MPASAVIPALKAYVKVAEVRKLVVDDEVCVGVRVEYFYNSTTHI